MKITAFWDVTPYSLVEQTASVSKVEEWKLGASLRNYAVSHPRKLQFHKLHMYTGSCSHGQQQDQGDHTVIISISYSRRRFSYDSGFDTEKDDGT